MALCAASISCQTRPLPVGVPAQRGTVPVVPLLKPLGGTMTSVRREAPSFFSAAVPDDAAGAGFVRPDVPPDTDKPLPARTNSLGAAAADALKRRVAAAAASAAAAAVPEEGNKPTFRSALEQASYMTATEQAGRVDSRRSGRFGLGFFGL